MIRHLNERPVPIGKSILGFVVFTLCIASRAKCNYTAGHIWPAGQNLTPMLYRDQVGHLPGVSFPACLLPRSQEVEFFRASALHSTRCLQCKLAGMSPSECVGLMFNAALRRNAQRSLGVVFS